MSNDTHANDSLRYLAMAKAKRPSFNEADYKKVIRFLQKKIRLLTAENDKLKNCIVAVDSVRFEGEKTRCLHY